MPLDEMMGTQDFFDVLSGKNRMRKKQLEQEQLQKQQQQQIDNSPLRTKSLHEYIDTRLDEIRPKLTKLDNRNRLQTMSGKSEVLTDIGESVDAHSVKSFRHRTILNSRLT